MPEYPGAESEAETIHSGGVNPPAAFEPEAEFLFLDLSSGKLSVGPGQQYPGCAPATVGACWSIRWPIPPVSTERAARLLESVKSSAANLVARSTIRMEELGVTLEGGAGVSIDTIQRECATLWREGLARTV